MFLLKIDSKKLLKVTKNKFPILNIGSGESISIKKLAILIKQIIKFDGKVIFNNKYPDGTMKKNLNSSKILKLGWKPKISLKSGLERVIKYKLNKEL